MVCVHPFITFSISDIVPQNKKNIFANAIKIISSVFG